MELSEKYISRMQQLSGVLYESILDESGRVDFLKKKFMDMQQDKYRETIKGTKRPATKNEKEIFIKQAEDTFNQILAADPSPNKMFTQWLIGLYFKGALLPEDFYKATEDLELYEKVKQRLPVEKRDINKYKNLQDLYNTVKPYEKVELISKTELEKAKKLEGADRVYEDAHWLVLIPKTKEAACLYGKETRWCTASHSNNYFDHYNKSGRLYIIMDKSIKDSAKENPLKKLQFHFESKQFMDATDGQIEIGAFLRKNPELLAVFKKLKKITGAFELEHRLLPKEKAIMVLEDPIEREKLIKAHGLEWVFNYYEEIGEKGLLADLLLRNEKFLDYILKTHKIEDVVKRLKSMGKEYEKDTANLLYSNNKIREYLLDNKTKGADLDNYIKMLVDSGPLGKKYAKDMTINSKELYDIYKAKGALPDYYNVISQTTSFGQEGLDLAVKMMNDPKLSKEFDKQHTKEVRDMMLGFMNTINGNNMKEGKEYLKNILGV